MYVVIAIHHPREEYVDEFLAFITSLEAATRGSSGLIEFGSYFDEQNGRLVEMSVWESKEDFEENVSALNRLREELRRDFSRCRADVLRLGRPRRRTRMTPGDIAVQERRTRGSSTA